MRGAFIVFEGIDGSGKSTCLRSVAERLRGKSPIVTAEPSDGPVGRLLMDGTVESALAETLLFVADRAEHTERIRSWVDDGRLVLCDRYYASTLAYQSSALDAEGNDPLWLWELNRPVIMEPDLTIVFDIDPELGLQRAAGRGEMSKFEKKDYLRRVREAYLALAEEKGYVIVDASRPAEDVLEEALHIINEKLEA